MPIDELRDIRAKVKEYLDTKVTVTISPFTPAAGTSLGPGEKFTFKVTVANANAANFGVRLRNVKYRVSAGDGTVVKLVVPLTGGATDFDGVPLPGSAVVRRFIFHPFGLDSEGDNFALDVGDTDSLSLTGIADTNPSGGLVRIKASILADVDLNYLFPKGENTVEVGKLLTVTG
jgi:hypothetical protein